MKRLVVLSLPLAVAAGCGNGDSSHASDLIYRGQEFIGKHMVSPEQYEHVQLVGVVSEKVAANRLPVEERSSNELAKGTEIYKVDENRLLAKVDDRQYRLFELKK